MHHRVLSLPSCMPLVYIVFVLCAYPGFTRCEEAGDKDEMVNVKVSFVSSYNPDLMKTEPSLKKTLGFEVLDLSVLSSTSRMPSFTRSFTQKSDVQQPSATLLLPTAAKDVLSEISSSKFQTGVSEHISPRIDEKFNVHETTKGYTSTTSLLFNLLDRNDFLKASEASAFKTPPLIFASEISQSPQPAVIEILKSAEEITSSFRSAHEGSAKEHASSSSSRNNSESMYSSHKLESSATHFEAFTDMLNDSILLGFLSEGTSVQVQKGEVESTNASSPQHQVLIPNTKKLPDSCSSAVLAQYIRKSVDGLIEIASFPNSSTHLPTGNCSLTESLRNALNKNMQHSVSLPDALQSSDTVSSGRKNFELSRELRSSPGVRSKSLPGSPHVISGVEMFPSKRIDAVSTKPINSGYEPATESVYFPSSEAPVTPLMSKAYLESSVSDISVYSTTKSQILIAVTPTLSSQRSSKEASLITVSHETEKSLPSETPFAETIVVSDISKESQNRSTEDSSVAVEAQNKYFATNKTSRDDSPQLDDIISGIIHLLAGDVKIVRPPAHFFGHTPPARLIKPSSTRINNRGPPTFISPSRTVVLFSQPDHHITLVPRPVPPPTHWHLRPTNIQRLPYVAHTVPANAMNIPVVRPEKPSSTLSPVVHLYKPLVKPPFNTKRPSGLPLDGEIFIAVGKPPLPNAEKPHFSNAGRPSLPGINGRPLANSGSSTSKTFTNEKAEISGTFEVFRPHSDKTTEVPGTHRDSPFIIMNSNSESLRFNSQPQTNDENSGFSPSVFEKPTDSVTEWAPLLERPDVKQRPKPEGDTVNDDDVIIITQPTVFDLTVTNALGGVRKPIIASEPSVDFSITTSTEAETFPQEDSYTVDEHTSLTEISSDNYELNSEYVDTDFTGKGYSADLHSAIDTAITTENSAELFEKSSVSANTETSSVSTMATKERELLLPSATSPAEGKTHIRDDGDPRTFESNQDRSTSYSTNSTSTGRHFTSTEVKLHTSRTFLLSSEVPASLPTTSLPVEEKILLGRPIVVPVDIEEVRPYVGAINPDQDGPRLNIHIQPDRVPPRQPSTINNSRVPISKPGTNTAEGKKRTTSVPNKTTRRPSLIRTPSRGKPNSPLVRIDTCIVGDESTCDASWNETCKSQLGISSCQCRPGYARLFIRGPCQPVVSVMMSLKVDRMGSQKIAFSQPYNDPASEEYKLMEFEAKQAVSSLFSYTAFSRHFLGASINKFYAIGGRLIINATVHLEDNRMTRSQSLRLRLRQEVVKAITSRNQNIGDSKLHVDGPLNPVPAVEDVNECSDFNLNDCSANGFCKNVFGSFECRCMSGYTDPYPFDQRRSGRKCSACSIEYCHNHGQCYIEDGKRLCKCTGNYIGSRCDIDSEVLGVALGASVAAVIIILLTLACLCIWNRRWKQEQQRTEAMSARSVNSNQTFSYLNKLANVNTYRLTMEDRLRWAHISDVVGNIYAKPEPGMNQSSALTQQGTYPGPSRRQSPVEDVTSWYNCATRPRSRAATYSQPQMSGSFCDMDYSTREIYLTAGKAPSRRHLKPNMSRAYYS